MKSTLFHALSVAGIASATAARTLLPVQDLSELIPGVQKRATPGVEAFQPTSEYAFLYAQKSKREVFVANFTLQTPGDTEFIMPIEAFADQLKGIYCDDAAKTIKLEFPSLSEFEEAQKVWNWVNEKPENTFTLVTKAGQCDPDTLRDPYSVSDIWFHNGDLTATLSATRQQWSEAAHNFHITSAHYKTPKPEQPKIRRQNNGVPPIPPPEVPDDDDDYVFWDSKINELLANTEAIQEKLVASNTTNSTGLPQLQEEAEKAIDLLAEAVENKSFAVLADIADVYGEEVKKIVDNCTTFYNKFQDDAEAKYREADRIADVDIDASWGLYEDALELQDQASQTIPEAFIAITALVQPEAQPSNIPQAYAIRRRELKRQIRKRNIFTDIGNAFKRAGEFVVNGVANLLGANKPATLDLTTSFNPPLFTVDRNEFGIGVTAGPKLATGGKLVALVEVKVSFDKPSLIRLKVTPDNIFASAEFEITADGTLNKKLLQTLGEKNIPVPGAAINVPGLLELGPFVTIAVKAGIERMEAKQAKFHVGARADIPADSIILVDFIDNTKNQFNGWNPKLTQIGPDFTGELNGELTTFLSLSLNFKASLLGGKFEAAAGIEAQAPKFGLQFAAKNDPAGVCTKETKQTKSIELGATVGININLNAHVTPSPNNAPPFQKDLLDFKVPLFNACFPFGEEGSPVQEETVPPALRFRRNMPVRVF
ncbi:hypothetical protein P154DRAFT_617760 [Amniculicola lignicola CBS 123094]|uniref:Uncharacterized protein n=1 Tax=Amniculicola lignicola CBS 123094 TaxID=1392246 RepID=A0A6A5X0Q5_9PLEO|nr:hypothetical protein P154DRAFT_617760 [Amniculicola lignicola CBS 123094]